LVVVLWGAPRLAGCGAPSFTGRVPRSLFPVKAARWAAARLLGMTGTISIRISPRFHGDYSTRAASAGRVVHRLKSLKDLGRGVASKRPWHKGFEKSLRIDPPLSAHRSPPYLRIDPPPFFIFSLLFSLLRGPAVVQWRLSFAVRVSPLLRPCWRGWDKSNSPLR